MHIVLQIIINKILFKTQWAIMIKKVVGMREWLFADFVLIPLTFSSKLT